ncbi:hypothetical protein B0H19DRAFT_1183563 [Mycena capillaripes]|nr:hypothetical protein B0H19DRAFT_1183563 [Mycena capillaripes]
MTYVLPNPLRQPNRHTRPIRPSYSASNLSSWLCLPLLASACPYALNPPNPPRRVCLCTCGGAIRGAEATTLADGNRHPRLHTALVHRHTAACPPSCRRPSSPTPPPVLVRHAGAILPDARAPVPPCSSMHKSQKPIFLALCPSSLAGLGPMPVRQTML